MPNYCQFCGYPVEGATCTSCDLRHRRAKGQVVARCSACQSEMSPSTLVCPVCGRQARRARRVGKVMAALAAGGGLGCVAWFFLQQFLTRF